MTSGRTMENRLKEGKSQEPPDGKVVLDKGQEFLLEDVYPDATNLFISHELPVTPQGDFVVAIDTNVLILPYKIDANDLSALSSTYRGLAAAKRLFVPARVSREFIRLRDRKLAEVVTGLTDRLSRLEAPKSKLSPILEGVEGYDKLPELAEAAEKAVADYRGALKSLIGKIKQWRGNDPVSELYAEVFSNGNIIEAPGDRSALKEEWTRRLGLKLPPGYKDGGKEDTGIGDFLIWKSLLHLGKTLGKDLVFLTLDDKGDWAVRAGNEAVYPRPELVDEYRRVSGGRSLRISHLGDFLRQMEVSEATVVKVKQAETVEINIDNSLAETPGNLSAFWLKSTARLKRSEAAKNMLSSASRLSHPVYRITVSVNNIHQTVIFSGLPFELHLEGSSIDQAVLLTASDGGRRLASVYPSMLQERARIDDYEFSDAVYVEADDYFLARTEAFWFAFKVELVAQQDEITNLITFATAGLITENVYFP